MSSKTIIKSAIFLMLFFSLLGCSSNEYQEFKENYESVYFEITDVIDTKDIVLTLERLQTESISHKITELKKLLDCIKDNVPENQKQHYKEMNEWYDGLVFLRSFNGKVEQLSFDDKHGIFKEIVLIDLRRDYYKSQR